MVLEKAAWDIIERDLITNEHIQSLIGKYLSLTTKIGQHKLKYFCHVCRRAGDHFENKIIIQGTFKGIRGNRRPKVRWSDTLKKITGHSLNALPYWRWKILGVWSQIMVTTGQQWTWKWRQRLNLGVEQMWHPAFCLPIHRTRRTKIPWLW